MFISKTSSSSGWIVLNIPHILSFYFLQQFYIPFSIDGSPISTFLSVTFLYFLSGILLLNIISLTSDTRRDER